MKIASQKVGLKEGIKSMSRYRHWFWNSIFIDWVATKVTQFDTWLWKKQTENRDDY